MTDTNLLAIIAEQQAILNQIFRLLVGCHLLDAHREELVKLQQRLFKLDRRINAEQEAEV